jgi:hypothetical protein
VYFGEVPISATVDPRIRENAWEKRTLTLFD